MMTETFRLDLDQARAYEERFVPALFAQWVRPLLDCAGLREGQRVLDVACGTGVVARAAADVVGPAGHVEGIDLAPAMIEVARQVRPDIDWGVADAQDLPFESGSFDVVLCQSALFFFRDPAAAVSEMARVLAPGGVVVLQTYAGLGEQPGYGPFVELVEGHAGHAARSLLETYWSMGDLVALTALVEQAGLTQTDSRQLLGAVTFPSVDALVDVEVRGTPLADRIDEATVAAITRDAVSILARWCDPTGVVTLPIRARFVAATTTQPGA
jgi:ubiquinone/menaquinone biosynthesis C-methylase UbiE